MKKTSWVAVSPPFVESLVGPFQGAYDVSICGDNYLRAESLARLVLGAIADFAMDSSRQIAGYLHKGTGSREGGKAR
jgi:hypothetical protein